MSVTERSTRRFGWILLGILACTGPDAARAAEGNPLAEGRELFERDWTPGDPRSHAGDGLGPLYNDTSCVACHNLGGPGGGGPASKGVEIITLSILTKEKLDREKLNLEEIHPGFLNADSVLLHRYGTDRSYRAWRLRRTDGVELAEMSEAGGSRESQQLRETAQRTLTASGTRVSAFIVSRGASGRVKGGLSFLTSVSTSRRNPPALFGAGLIDAIPAEALRAAAKTNYRDFPEIHGRVNALPDGRVGRFGWKAQTTSLKEFVEAACAAELGLEVPGHHQARLPLDFNSKQAAGLDLTQAQCDALTAYVASLPAPTARTGFPDVERGRVLFERVGCAACHLPELGAVKGIYSDLLLHDMGADLSDAGSYYGVPLPVNTEVKGPRAVEWRTPPLWGFRDSGPYLHDGRAETLEQAVAFHGGEAERSSERFFALSLAERYKVQTFLNSLTAPGPAVAAR